MIRLAAVCLLATTAACAPEAVGGDAFSQSGELVALSGGSAGAANACVSCHGLQGEGDGNLSPRLAGLDRGYLQRQLGFYAGGERAHARMAAIVGLLDPVEEQKVATYYAALPAPAAACPTAGRELAAAERLYREGDARRGLPSCASCHGVTGEGNAGNPALAGQPAPYLERQLAAWRNGERYGDPLGAMTKIAKTLTPAELAALSAHAARLPGGLNRPGSTAACLPARRADPRNGA